ncbi:metallophosphoesterase [Neobacillus sp. PS3-40]|uniref:metallophosphoesterase n=1 Tax=Neobacillus sp. PS3-40 TaxID=3070679 RepID=UPI0027E04344|nr:metallophosphoesterase [Neobacillus sp. PS3-40]WML44773.1 metallophosphoesterase [Neobacillus sp. PS3-40]
MAYIICTTIILIFLAIFIKAHRNTKKVMVKTITVPVSKGNRPLKILHLSDIHLENISISPEELFQNVSNQSIDLIALTGDYLERKKNIPKLIPYLNKLKDLNPRLGIFAVFGNHDYYLKGENFDYLKRTLEKHGCITLQNQHITLDDNGRVLNIIGIDDYHTKKSNLQKSYQNLPNGYNLVLTHDPNIVLEMKSLPYDYLLSGHFHGGQILWPKPYHLLKMGKLVRMNIIKGLHYQDGKPFYISEGLGQTGVNIRIGSRPEITFHHIS